MTSKTDAAVIQALVEPLPPGGDRRPGIGYGAGFEGDHHLAKPNYQYEKRQRELAKKAKKAEKAARKTTTGPDDGSELPDDDAPAPSGEVGSAATGAPADGQA